MTLIKNVHLYDNNILIIDNNNELWIMGDNTSKKTGFYKRNKAIYNPININIKLEDNDSIAKFHVSHEITSILTLNGKLYVTKHKVSKKKKSKSESRTLDYPNGITYPNDPDTTDDIFNTDDSDEGSTVDSDEDDREIIYSDDDTEEEEEEEEEESESDSENLSENKKDFCKLSFKEKKTVDVQIENATADNTVDSTVANNQIEYTETYNFYDELVDRINNGDFKKYKEGFVLVSDNVEMVVHSFMYIYFKIKNDVYIYSESLASHELLFQNNFALNLEIIEKEYVFYYKIIFPFEPEKVIFYPNFIHIQSKNYHHVLTVSRTACVHDANLRWIYFKTDLDIVQGDIHCDPFENTVYIVKKDLIYKYSNRFQKLLKFENNFTKVIINKNNYDNVSEFFILKEDGLYTDNYVLTKKKKSHYLYNYAIYNDFDLKISLISCEKEKRYILTKDILFFNIFGLKHYYLVEEGLFYFDESETLCCLTKRSLTKSVSNVSKIEKISNKKFSFNIYMFEDIPGPITNIIFSDYVILIQTATSYYYLTIQLIFDREIMEIDDCYSIDNFWVKCLTEIKPDLFTKNTLVKPSQVLYLAPEKKNKISLSVQATASKFKKLLNIIESIRCVSDFSISFVEGKNVLSYGGGVTREFMDTAVKEFSDTYLIKGNYLVDYDLEKMAAFTNDELYCLGILFHTVICQSKCNLPIRLPLSFHSCILKKDFSLQELEYFAEIENPEIFNLVLSYKEKPDLIIDFGYDSYTDCLETLCKLKNSHSDTLVKEVSNNLTKETLQKNEVENINNINKCLRKGFNDYFIVNKLKKMNIPTFDYYLSGKFNLDRGLLIKNLSVTKEDSKNVSKFLDFAVQFINQLSEKDLKVLLKNWTGYSVVLKSPYYIHILNKNKNKNKKKSVSLTGCKFSTCMCEITIMEELFRSKNIDTLGKLLISPCETMVQ